MKSMLTVICIVMMIPTLAISHDGVNSRDNYEKMKELRSGLSYFEALAQLSARQLDTGRALKSGRNGTDLALGGSNEPTIAVNPVDPQNIAYASLFELRVSTDGGATFQPRVTPPATVPYVPNGDPSIAFDGEGRLFWTYLGVSWHPDTWSASDQIVYIAQCDPSTGEVLPGYPVNVVEQVGGDLFADKQWFTIDTSPISPYYGRLHLVWSDISLGHWRTLTSYSTDQGLNWSSAVPLADPFGLNFPAHNAVASNGDLYVAIHAQPIWEDGADGVTGHVFVQRSTDGGASYGPATFPFLPGEADISFNRQSQGGRIDGARFLTLGSVQPWVLPDPTQEGRVFVVACDDPDNVHGSGDDADVFITVSNDHGETWSDPQRIDSGPGESFQLMPTASINPVTGTIAVHYYDNRNGNLNQDGNYLLDVFATHGTYSSPDMFEFISDYQINDVPFDPDEAAPCRYNCGKPLWAVWGTDTSDVFAVGNRCTILHYNGVTWEDQSFGFAGKLFDVWGFGPDDVYAVGGRTSPFPMSFIYRYDGNSWLPQNTDFPGKLLGIWGSAPDDIYTVGEDGTILHCDGETWTEQPSPTGFLLSGIWGNGPTDIFAVGESGTILHYNGVTWEEHSSGTDELLYDVWGSAPDDVYAVGWNGSIVHYDGESWTLTHLDDRSYFWGIWGSGASDIYVLTLTSGAVIHYDGDNWSTMSPLPFGMLDIWGDSAGNLFAVGEYGTICHYDGVAWQVHENPTIPYNSTLRIGEYNGVALVGDSHETMHAVWCGNENNVLGDPISQQIFFDFDVVTGIGSESMPPPGSTTMILSSAPNPFGKLTSFNFDLATRSRAQLRIYDVRGRLVRDLLDETLGPRHHQIGWDGRDNRGRLLPSGSYWCRLDIGIKAATQRIVLLR